MSIHDRTVARTKGCWNCLHFDCGQPAIDRVKSRIQADAKYFAERGVTIDKMPDAIQGLEHVLTAVQNREAGICTSLFGQAELDKKAGRPVHFVAAAVLCNCWDAAAGAKTTKEKATDDCLPDELLDRAGMPQVDNGDGSGGSSS